MAESKIKYNRPPKVTREKLSYLNATALKCANVTVPSGDYDIKRMKVLELPYNAVAGRINHIYRDGSDGNAIIAIGSFNSGDEINVNILWV